MAPLKKSDVAGWSLPRVEREMRQRLNEVMSIRNLAGGDFASVRDPHDLDLVREHSLSLNILGERRDELRVSSSLRDVCPHLFRPRTMRDRIRDLRPVTGGATSTKERKVDFRDAGVQFTESRRTKSGSNGR